MAFTRPDPTMPTVPPDLSDLLGGASSPAPMVPGATPPLMAPTGGGRRGGGIDWMSLIKLAAPVIGQAAMGDDDGGFMTGFLRGQSLAQQEKLERDAADQKRRTAGADYLMKIHEHAAQLDDPIAFDQFMQVAEDAGVKAGYLKAGEARGRIKFNESKRAEARLKELSEQLTALERGGYNLDDLAESGSAITLKDGTQVPIGRALDMVHARPTLNGQQVPRPKKQPTATGTMDERAASLLRRIRATKDPEEATALQAEYNDLIKAKTDLGGAGRAPLDPEVAEMNKTLKQLQIDAAKNRGQGGLDPSQQFSMEERLARAWTSASQSAREVERQYSIMKTGLERFRKGDKNGGSQAVMVTFQKILDPTSVVRESEYARTTEGQALLDRIQGYVTRLSQGGTTLSDGEMASMVETARQFMESLKTHTQGQRRRIDAQVKQYKLNPAGVFDDVLLGGDPGAGMPPPPPAAGAPPAPGRTPAAPPAAGAGWTTMPGGFRVREKR